MSVDSNGNIIDDNNLYTSSMLYTGGTKQPTQYLYSNGNTGSTYSNTLDIPAVKQAVPTGVTMDQVQKMLNDKIGGNSGSWNDGSYYKYMKDPGLFGLENGTWNNLGQFAGLAGTTYGLYDSLLGDKHDMFKTQMSALKQNMANIAEDRAAHRTFQNNFGGGINSAFKGGLAASAATPK